jgi:hypothetical protein
MSGRSILTVVTLALGLVPSVTHAQKTPAACQPLIDAMHKQILTPHHIYTTDGGDPSKGRVMEVISIDGSSYFLHQGSWRKSPLGTKEMLAQMDSALTTATAYSCQHLPDESVAGSATTVYRAHMENDGVKSDVQTWITKSTGLVMKQEEDLDAGAGAGKRHLSLRFEYTNVHAPAGAK